MKNRISPLFKRAAAFFLGAVLLLTCCPAAAFATSDDLQPTYCGQDAHTHEKDVCYTEVLSQICTDETPEHVHKDGCYEVLTTYTCLLSEHFHEEGCYLAPATEAPAESEPVAEEPVVEEPAVEEPVVEEPVAEAPETIISTDVVTAPAATAVAPRSGTIYFDLSLGDVTIANGTYSGKVWVKNGDTFTEKVVTGTHSNMNSYYVFQSNEEGNRGYVEYSGETITAVQYPQYDALMVDADTTWADYLKNPAVHSNVAGVVAQWKSAANGKRAATPYRIEVKGGENYTFTIDNIWSSYVHASSSRNTGGISFVPASKDSGNMGLIFVGDNRLENIHYSGTSTANRLTIGGMTGTDTLTVAATTAGSNIYSSAIGGSDNNGESVQTLELAGGGVLYAGAQHGDACTAIGGGGNGYAQISITGGTVIAVTAYNGAAIGGGFGGSSPGGGADISIAGGKVYAYNTGNGAAIGGGSSNNVGGGTGNVTITGGTVIADTKGLGAAIGGGSSAKSTGGSGTVIIGVNATVTATSAGTHSLGGGYGKASATSGASQVRLPKDVSAAGSKVTASVAGLNKFIYNDPPSGYSGAIYFSGSDLPDTSEVHYSGHYMLGWVAEGTDTYWAIDQDQEQVYVGKWLPVTTDDTIYFDLSLGNVKITASSYQGYIYQRDLGKAVPVRGDHAKTNKYYIYQSTDANRAASGINTAAEVIVPQYSRVSGWADYITDNDSVTDVVTAWPGKAAAVGRAATPYRVAVSGNSSYDVTIDNIWSSYCEVSVSRNTAGVGFIPTGKGSMSLTYVGDNRLEALHYNSAAAQKLTLQGSTGGDTLTVAATTDGGNHWCSAIGGNDGDAYVHNLYITQGTLYAGTRRQDNCTAIGAGGNGYGSIYISGDNTTVTAVVSSSGTAIGGGIGYHSAGGDALVDISGGKVYAYNHGILLKDTASGSPFHGQYFAVPATAIGGGSSIESDGNASTTIRISGGQVFAQSVHGAAIGGGGSSTKNGGKATIQITGGTVTATSIGGSVYGIKDGADDYSDVSQTVSPGVSIGGGTGHLSGGYADLTISGESTVVKTGSIGGGKAGDGNPLGYARVQISGGRIQGQVVMQQTTTEGEYCSFTMTGGTIDNSLHKQAKSGTFSDGTNTYTFLEENGGAVCMYDTHGITKIQGGTIQNSYGKQGGAVYMTGGSFTLSGGTVQSCQAEDEGGAVYLGGGEVSIQSGAIVNNTAGNNGGGIAVSDGQIVMSGGKVDGNTAVSGNGGGMYVSSTGSDVAVKIYSGSVSNNKISKNGGAVAVEGHESSKITVQTGVNKAHYVKDENGAWKLSLGFDHTEPEGSFVHEACPVIKNNSSSTSGGAFYIVGGAQTKLNLYCLEELNNTSSGDLDVHGNPLSTFLMVEGGAVLISTSDTSDYDEVRFDEAGYGSMHIHGGVHVRAGTLTLYGTMDNPSFDDKITIDLPHEDGFKDYRGSTTMIKLSYHENFTNKDSEYESTQTAIDIKDGQVYKISDSLYAHDGYKIHGWNIDRNANKDTTTGWFWPNDEYTFYALQEGQTGSTDFVGKIHRGDLTIYAIWEAIGYRIQFAPGCTQYRGDMEEMAINYDETKALTPNAYIRPGYCFKQWRYVKDDGTSATLSDGQDVTNLTRKANFTVVLTAQWEKCDHTGTTFTYLQDGSVITKICDKCHYEATASLSAADAVYDGQKHEATLILSDPAFWSPAVSYTGQTLKPADADDSWTASPIPEEKLCINAGDYTATICEPGDTADRKTVTVNYRIDKAKQPAPATRPTYVQPESDNLLTVNQIPAAERISAVSGAHVEYFVRYYAGGSEINENVVIPAADPDSLTHELTEALKTYAVFAIYPETDNYYASEPIAAESTFIFGGKLFLTVIPTDGISFWPGDASDNEQTLHVALKDGYYLLGSDFTFEKEITNGAAYDLDDLVITKGSEHGQYYLQAEPADEETRITITVGTARKIPYITSAVKEKQEFGDFTPVSEPTVSRDSAFTVRYQVTAYDTDAYRMPALQFGTALPVGSTVILRDRTNGSYWSYTASSATTSIALNAFRRMGSSEAYAPESADLDLQFVVDFSQSAGITGNSLTTALLVEKRASRPDGSVNNAPDLTVTTAKNRPDAYVKLGSAAFTLVKPADQPNNTLLQQLQLEFNAPAASKWDHRDAALIVEPVTALPAGASLLVSIGSDRALCYPHEDGSFLLPLGNYIGLGKQLITIQLQSDVFPETAETYAMQATLWLAESDAEASPMNGSGAAQQQMLSFTSSRAPYQVKIVHESDTRLFAAGDSITVTVRNGIPAGYRMVVELHRQYQDGSFADTGTKAVVNGNAYTYDLSFPGNYCIVAKINRADQYSEGYTIDSAKYYFIVQ